MLSSTSRAALLAVLFAGVTASASAAAPQDGAASNDGPSRTLDGMVGKKLFAIDGSTIALMPSESGLAREIVGPTGAVQKTMFEFINDKLGTVADAKNVSEVIGVFRATGAGIEIDYADGSSETLATNAAGGIILESISASSESCTAWYPEGHTFTIEERKAQLAKYASRLGLADANEKKIADTKVGCTTPVAPRAADVPAKAEAAVVAKTEALKTEAVKTEAVIADAGKSGAVTAEAVKTEAVKTEAVVRPPSAPRALTTPPTTAAVAAAAATSAAAAAAGAAAKADPAAGPRVVEVRTSEVHPVDVPDANATEAVASPAVPAPKPPQVVASLTPKAGAADSKPAVVGLLPSRSGAADRRGASTCLSVESDGTHWGFRNHCGYSVQFAYCQMSGSDQLASCRDGTVSGSVAANGFGALVADESLKEVDAKHDFRWVACQGGAGEVIPRLDQTNPPAGRCVR